MKFKALDTETGEIRYYDCKPCSYCEKVAGKQFELQVLSVLWQKNRAYPVGKRDKLKR